MSLMGHVKHMEDLRSIHLSLVGKLKRWNHFQDMGLNWRIILNQSLCEYLDEISLAPERDQ